MDLADETVARGGGAFSTPSPERPSAETQAGTAARPTLSKLIDDLRAALGARLQLVELEGRRAVWAAAYIFAFAIGAALLAITAWLILIGALIFGAVAVGVPWVLTVVLAIALHAGGVFLLVRAITSLVNDLSFAATRRTLSRVGRMKAKDGGSA